jgi:UMP-CMP kinase
MRLSFCLLVFMQARAAAAFASSAHVLPSAAPASIHPTTAVTKCFSSASSSLVATQCLSTGNNNSGAGKHGRRLLSRASLFGGLRGGSTMGNDDASGASRASRNSAPFHQLHASSSSSSAAAASDKTAQEEEPYDIDSDPDMMRQISEAAAASHGVTGPSIRPATFGSLPFLDTSALDKSTPKQHRVLFVLGGPGAGKGTQSDLIVDNYKCVHLSVGELLREARASESNPHAELIEDCLVHGKIVPVEISLDLLKNAMDEAYECPAADGSKYGTRIFLVDGFPRNFDNLSGWTDNMPKAASVMGALVYDCPQNVLEARIMSRAETSGRSDDNITSARKRFRTFQMQTMPVVRALEEVEKAQDVEDPSGNSRIRIAHIEATGTVEEVWDATKAAMDAYATNDVLSANARLIQAAVEGDADAYMMLSARGMFAQEGEDASKFDDEKLKSLFVEYEMPGGKDSDASNDEADGIWNTVISNASIEMQTGTKAVVSYDRTFAADGKKETLRETRVWSHEENGWTCIHFYRTPK